MNKALVSSLHKSGAGLPSPELKEQERYKKNVSKHDQTLGGYDEQHGSQHDESIMR